MSKKLGAAYEAQFAADALRKGLDVLEPKGDYLPYDFIVHGRTDAYKVQVKGTSAFSKGRSYYKIVAGSRQKVGKTTKAKAKLDPDLADILAAYMAPSQVWYFVPIDKIEAVSMYFSPDNKFSQAQYEIWKEAWNLFK